MAESRERKRIFPFRWIWEELDDRIVDFGNLEAGRSDFALLAEINLSLGFGVPHVSREQLTELVGQLGLETEVADRLVDRLELATGWYLGTLTRHALGQDLPTVRKLLGEVAKDARRLHLTMSKIDPRTAAVLHFMHPAELTALLPDRPLLLSDLAHQVSDFADVVARAVADMPSGRGRRRDYLRNMTLVLTMRAVEEAIGQRVELSRGTTMRPEPHFTNASGRLIRDLFAKMGFAQESILAQAAERVRRNGRP